MVAAFRVAGQGSDEGAWQFFSSGHSNAIGMGGWPLSSTNILRITAFTEGWSGVLMSVDEQDVATVSNVAYNWANQGTRQEQLASSNVLRLRQLFRELSQSTNSVPFWITNMSSMRTALPTSRLVMVSFHDRADWIQRQYDDRMLPKAVFECYDLIIPAGMGTYRINRGR